ncbi:MAG TPA: S9 family peptidase [Pyrinomonadaceae bacterium]|nr:S9 family peptidase [Pyrinomonadaceae bacterium]
MPNKINYLRFILLITLCFIFSNIAFSQGKELITHESMWLMKRVGAPVPSPDGKWVVFSMTEPAYDEKDQGSDLWIVPADGSAKPRRLTFSKVGESGAVWSPDGKKIAFSARREGDDAAQIYILNVEEGGEAIRVTNISTGARNPNWRPDGGAILFASSVYPGTMNDDDNKKAATERKNRKYKARVFDSFPVRNWDRWIDEMQTHLFVQELQEGAKAKDLLAGTKLVTEKGFGGAIGSGNDEIGATWSPDGSSVFFNATTDRTNGAFAETTMEIFQVSTNGGEPRQITKADGSYGRPTFSPDGKTLYATFNPNTEKVFNISKLVSIDTATGNHKVLTANLDNSVNSFAFTPDGKTIYLTAEDAGLEKVYSMPATGGNATLAMEQTKGCYTNLVIPAKANAVFANWDSAINPPEIFKLDLANKTSKALTEFNKDALAKWDVAPVQHFWFTSKGGKKIHNMLVTPPKFDSSKKYPLIVLMHGGPHSQWRDNWGIRWNYHMIASPGYVVLLTNYTGSTGFGEKFAQDIQGDPLKTPGDEINQAADEAIKQFSFIDSNRQCAAGASYGGHLANWMEATTTRYKCIVAHAGLVSLESQWGTSDSIYGREKNLGSPHWEGAKIWKEQSPSSYAKNFKTPILVTVGENDFRVPINNSLENWAILQRMKVPSRLIVFPDANHWILKGEDSKFFYSELLGWFKKYL